MEAGDIVGAIILGNIIRKTFPNDYHFLCGCSNFDPFGKNEGHNEMFRKVARKHFRRKIAARTITAEIGSESSVRGEVEDVMELANSVAKETSGVEGSRFRIWKPIYGKPKKRLNESNWKESSFKDITENLGSLKRNLEWPLRKALEHVRKQLQAETVGRAPSNGLAITQGGTPPSNGLTITQGGPAPSHALTITQGGPAPSHALTITQGGPAPSDGLTIIPPVRTFNRITQPPMARSIESAFPIAVKAPRFAGATVPQEQLEQFEHPNPKRSKRYHGDPNAVVKEYVSRYNTPEIQDALERMDQDRGSKDLEDWGKEVCTARLSNPKDKRAIAMSKFRKVCLNLVYDLVKAWEDFGFSDEFEQAIDCLFKSRRLTRILSFCLALDKGQSLYMMNHGTGTADYFSDLHLPKEQMAWIKYIVSHSGSSTLSRIMFRMQNDFQDQMAVQGNQMRMGPGSSQQQGNPTLVGGGVISSNQWQQLQQHQMKMQQQLEAMKQLQSQQQQLLEEQLHMNSPQAQQLRLHQLLLLQLHKRCQRHGQAIKTQSQQLGSCLSSRTVTDKCMSIVEALIDDESGWVFLEPVDPVALNLPDYFDVVKNPMDLSLVKKKLESASYGDTELFATDVRLVYNNAILYNGEASAVGEIAQTMLRKLIHFIVKSCKVRS